MEWEEGDEEVCEGGDEFGASISGGEEGGEVSWVVAVVDEANELVVVGQGLDEVQEHLHEVRIEMGLLGHHYYSN